MTTPKLVILGGPHSGKTHYAGQLYGRLQHSPKPTFLRIRDQETPSDLSALTSVLDCLENGNAAGHTPINTWAEVLLPLIDEKNNLIDICWSDYGGEQLFQIFESREVSENWQKHLEAVDGWVLLIRLNNEAIYSDALEQLSKQKNFSIYEKTERCSSWDANAKWTELLQILLYVSNIGRASQIKTPRLAILLSCYDELLDSTSNQFAQEKKPMEILSERLPLVATFVKNNWDKDSITIWGLSSLGKNLEENSNDDDFSNSGPEHQGWIINPDGGEKDHDLTKPIQWILNKS